MTLRTTEGYEGYRNWRRDGSLYMNIWSIGTE